MLNFLNPLGLVVKYAIIGVLGSILSIFIVSYLGMSIDMSYTTAALAGLVGGAIGGFIRKKN